MRIALALAVIAAPAMATETNCKATAQAYGQIEWDMTYAQVAEIVGCGGFEYFSQFDEAGSIQQVRWTGNGNPITSQLEIRLRDGNLVGKSQTDLR